MTGHAGLIFDDFAKSIHKLKILLQFRRVPISMNGPQRGQQLVFLILPRS
jgi:hypothetical protein